MRIAYRVGQFFKSVSARPAPEQLAKASTILAPELMNLFLTMQPSEQAHSLQIMEELEKDSQTDHELLAAALLHDVGKARHPLRIWERVLIVIATAILPAQVNLWGAGKPHGWKRSFVIAIQHADWGADAAAAAGASPLTVDLIRRHQSKPGSTTVLSPGITIEERFLQFLQFHDDLS